MQGVFIYDYVESSHPTDFLAMAFVLGGWVHTCNIIIKKSQVDVLAAALLFAFASIIRYQYMPVCVLSLLWLLYIGWKQKEIIWKRSGFIISISLIAIIGAVLLYQKSLSGNYVYILSPHMTSGWYPNNLVYFHPFVIHSFINYNFWGIQLSSFSEIPHGTWMIVFRIAAIPVSILLLIKCWQWLKRRLPSSFSNTDSCWMIGGLLSAGIILLLVFLSITTSPDSYIGKWTFVMDSRYYAFPMLFIQLFVWYWAFTNKSNGNIFRKITTILLVVLFAIECVHGFYFIFKKLRQPLTTFSGILPAQAEMKSMIRFIKEQQIKGNRKIVVGGTDNQFGYFANWYGANGLFNLNLLKTEPIHSSQPAILLLVFEEGRDKEFGDFIKRTRASFREKAGNYFFYTLEIEPGEVK